MYSGKIAVPPGGGGLRLLTVFSFQNLFFLRTTPFSPDFLSQLNHNQFAKISNNNVLLIVR
jgi:hypothetical protein